MTIVIILIVALLLLHLAGGARAHRRHYRQHGVHPNLYYTYGRGWYGSSGCPPTSGWATNCRLPLAIGPAQ
jgi:hypothetical protein